MLRLFEKSFFSRCKSQIFFIGDQNTGHGDRMSEAWRGSEKPGDGFAGLCWHSAYQEAPEVSFRGAQGGPAPPPAGRWPSLLLIILG